MGKAGERFRLGEVRSFLGKLYGPDLHAKRIDSLAGATLGVMAAASLAVALIGQALAQARGLVTKHAVKQVDRLLSNNGIDVWDSFVRWVPHQMSGRKEALVAMDWTDFDHDSQSTLVLSLVSGHGRAAPLLWLSVWKDEIASRRNDYEDACLRRLAELVPPECRVTILADRGFGDQKLFAFLEELGFGYVIRFRGNIHVTAEDGQTKPAAEWVGKDGRARKLRHARGDGKGPAGRGRGVRSCQGHERTLVPGRKRSGCDGCGAGQPLCQALDDRATVPRHQGSTVWHGTVGHSYRRTHAA